MIIKRLNNGAYGVVDLLNGHVLYVGTYCECVQELDWHSLTDNIGRDIVTNGAAYDERSFGWAES